jgi:cytochrome c peroxidase
MRIALMIAAALALAACSDSNDNHAKAPAKAAEQATPVAAAKETAKPQPPADLPEGMGPLPTDVPVPADNPITEAKLELGKKLYFEPALSKSGHFSCNSCHNLATYGVDNQKFSIGHKWQRGGRNTPTVLNSAFWSKQFWDGRAPLLEDQAKGPPLNPVEMASISEDEVVARLKQAGYEAEFKTVFGNTPDAISFDNMAKAIADFERTLITPNAPFDKYARGEGDISEAAKRGMKKVAEIGCTSCHSGPLFTNNQFMAFNYGTDTGVKSVSGKAEDDHLFRVQSWRNVAMTAPYFHDGSAKTLDEAIRIMARVQLGTELNDADVADIKAFLETLTGEVPAITYPQLPRPAGVALNWQE